MVRLNIHEAKTHLSRYLAKLRQGGSILLCRRNVPIAEIRPLPVRPKRKRPVGLGPKFHLPEAFFQPLPDEVLKAFEGDRRGRLR